MIPVYRNKVGSTQDRSKQLTPKYSQYARKDSQTHQELQHVIETLLKQSNVKQANLRVMENNVFNPKKKSVSPHQQVQKNQILTSKTPSNLSNQFMFNEVSKAQTTKAGFHPNEPKKVLFFNKQTVFDESQQVTVKTLERESTTVLEEPEFSNIPSILYGCANQTMRAKSNNQKVLVNQGFLNFKQDLNENEYKNSDYMLSTIQRNLFQNMYQQKQKVKVKKLNDPLIDDTLMEQLKQIDLTQKVPFLWIQQSDEGTTLSGSRSGELLNQNDKDKTQQFKDKFMVGKQIGSGSYASVRHCIDRTSLKAYALKIYPKFSLSLSRKKSILREIRLLQYVKHQHVVQIMDAVETNNHVNLLLELVQGTQLAQLYKSKQLVLSQIKGIVYQVAYALQHLHRLSVTHRDIKLENVLYVQSSQEVKIIDFGFSTLIKTKKKMFCGTPSYMAPEIVRRTHYYGQPVDMWALGIMMYALMCSHFPFKGSNDKDLYQRISLGEYNLSLVEGDEAQDLVKGLLSTNPDQRLTADEVLLHSWFKYPLIDSVSILLSKVQNAKREKPFNQKRCQNSNIKTIKYNNQCSGVQENQIIQKRGSFFEQVPTQNQQGVKSCLNSPRQRNGDETKPYLQEQLQSTVKKLIDQSENRSKVQKNYFQPPSSQHNQTIHPNFVPSFMSSMQSNKSQDSNYLAYKGQKNSNFGNLTFNDTSGLGNVSLNNSVVQQNDKTKLFQNFITRIVNPKP